MNQRLQHWHNTSWPASSKKSRRKRNWLCWFKAVEIDVLLTYSHAGAQVWSWCSPLLHSVEDYKCSWRMRSTKYEQESRFWSRIVLVIRITCYNNIRAIMIQGVCLLFCLRLFVCFNDNLDSYDIVTLPLQNRYNQINFLWSKCWLPHTKIRSARTVTYIYANFSCHGSNFCSKLENSLATIRNTAMWLKTSQFWFQFWSWNQFLHWIADFIRWNLISNQ